MSIYEHARNVFAIIGLLATSGFIGLVGWHAVAALRRRRATRLSERTKAQVRSQSTFNELDIGYESLGVIPIRDQEL